MFFSRGPLAISRLVVPLVVNAFDGKVLVRFAAHVRQEVRKRVSPSLADFNSASTPIFILRIFGIQAPGFHVLPTNIFRDTHLVISVGVAMP